MTKLGYNKVICHFIKGYNSITGNQSIIIDNLLGEIAWKKGNIYKVLDFVEIGDIQVSYLIDEARGYYQLINKNNLTLDSILTINEAIQCYGKITQACSSGIKNFVDNLDKVKSKYSIKEIIDLTKNQFGNQKFQDFFNNVNLIIEYEK